MSADLLAELEERLDRIPGDMLAYGPNYNRNVATSVSDARHAIRKGDVVGGRYFTAMTEMRAGIITWDEYVAATTNEALRGVADSEGYTSNVF